MKKNKLPLSEQPCPCGSGDHYAGCCMRWHQGEQHLQAPSAQALMRSRYTAYVFKLYPYLLDTWHPTTRPASMDDTDPLPKWIGLTVHDHQQQDDTHATVEFTARYTLNGKAYRRYENSAFEKINGQWYYIDEAIQ